MKADTMWPLDPELAHLNHVSFGAVSTPVAEERNEWLALLERDPSMILTAAAPKGVRKALWRVAKTFRTEGLHLLPVRNATEGMQGALNTMLSAADGHVLWVSAHEYSSVKAYARRKANALGVPLAEFGRTACDPAALIDELSDLCRNRPPMLLISHISSSTATVFPISKLAQWASSRGGMTAVDGAHGQGLLPILGLVSLDADFYVGNLHKWVGAPRTAAFVASQPGWNDIRPVIESWWASDEDLWARFGWPGTWDPTPWLSVSAALDVLEIQATGAVRAQQAELLNTIQGHQEQFGLRPLMTPDQAPDLMRTLRLPDEILAHSVKQELRDAGVLVWAETWLGIELLRLSVWMHNDEADAERYLGALPGSLARSAA